MTWWEYVQRHTQGDDTQAQIASRLGVDQTRVSAWVRDGDVPAPATAIKIARRLGVPPAEVLLAAGHITADEAGATVTHVQVDEPTDDELIDMLADRLKRTSESDARNAAASTRARGSRAVDVTHEVLDPRPVADPPSPARPPRRSRRSAQG